MDLDFSEEQTLLRSTVRKLCDTHFPLASVRAAEHDADGYTAGFWQALAESGLLGLRIPADYDGVEFGQLETAISYEEFGRGLIESPHFESAILAARTLQLAGSDAQRQQWLPSIAMGEAVLVPAWREPSCSVELAAVQMRAQQRGADIVLNGRKILVPFAPRATRLLVLVRHPQEPARMIGALVDPQQAGVVASAEPNHAGAHLFAVEFTDVVVAADACIGLQGDISAGWQQALLEGQIALAAQAIGGAAQMLDMTVEYAKVRKQFDRPIGGFQAIAHYLADRAAEIEGARVLVYQAAWACDQRMPFERLALMARLKAGAVYRRMTAVGTQIHGGIGFSTEGDPQLYFRRAKHQQLMYGDPVWLEQRIADCVFAGDYPSVD